MSIYERVMTETDRTIIRAMTLTRPQRRAVARDLGMTSPAMHQRLLRLLDDPAVERTMPVEVHRLQRVRDAMRRRRTL